MATKIITKNSSTTTAIPTAADLVQGELAVNVTDKRLFTENSVGAIVEVGTNPSTLTVTGEITANGGIDVTGTVTADGLLTVNAGENSSHIKVGSSRFMTISTGTDGTYADAITKLAIDSSVGQFSFFNANTNELLNISGTALTLPAGIDLITASAGTSNFRAGVNAGNSIIAGGNFNVVVGDEAGTAITTGDGNVAVGYAALSTEDGHGRNVAVGNSALTNQNAGANGYNVAVGHGAGLSVTTGVQNTLIGGLAGCYYYCAKKH
jgi:hypothetical protein